MHITQFFTFAVIYTYKHTVAHTNTQNPKNRPDVEERGLTKINLRYRSSPSQMFCKIGVHKNFAILTGKHLC